MIPAAGESFQKLVGTFEQMAAQWSGGVIRDPRVLEMGARWMKASFMWKRAFDATLEAVMAPLAMGGEPAVQRKEESR